MDTSGKTENEVHIEYFFPLDNQVSDDNYYFTSYVVFDLTDYDNIKPIIEELSKTIDYDLIALIDTVIS